VEGSAHGSVSNNCLDGSRNATDKVSQDGRSPDIGLKLESPEYEYGTIYPLRQSMKNTLGGENRVIRAIERRL
jgi:hypothetical protein